MASGTLSSDTLDLAELEWLPAGWSGGVQIGLASRVDGLSSVLTDWRVMTPGLFWSQNGSVDTIPSVRVDSRIALSIENAPDFSVDSLTLSVNDRIRARVRGRFDAARNRFSCRMEGSVENEGLASLVPRSLHEIFDDSD